MLKDTARFWLLLLGAGLVSSVAAAPGNDWGAPVDYNRDVRPILAANCFKCHGLDTNHRQAGLRLDTAEGALQRLPSGHVAVVPGKPAASELFQRITANTPMVMPPASTGKHLTERQVDTLRRWILQGGRYARHWSYIPPQRPALPPAPKGALAGWPLNPVDRFIAARFQEAGVPPSPEADRRTLIRRLSLDLVGLPPSPELVEAFVRDRSPKSYEKLVDRLLASPHYGERMAIYWLDLVRYADTDGYHGDRHRNVSLYRDYVINAFNQNMPFDRFTIEQLAGDLLPNATTDQKIASGFNRLNMVTREGGAQDKEYLAKYAAERVRTTSVVWLGATLGCAECHNHKFDPYSSKDFYRFEAFFADIQQVGLYPNDKEDLDPILSFPTKAQTDELASLDARIAPLKTLLNTPTPELAAAQAKWEQALKERLARKEPSTTPTPPDAQKPAAGAAANPQSAIRNPQSEDVAPPASILAILAIEPSKRTAEQQKSLAGYYRSIAPELKAARDELAGYERRRTDLDHGIPKTMVTVAVQPAVTRVLPRGNWMDDSGEVVTPGVPHFMPQITAEQTANRLALAKWLVSRQNPLTARILVNRLWMLMFGAGLSRSPGDFGAQGSPPTHPELLDWLSTELLDSGWNLKHVLRLIVTSRAYRQSSHATRVLRDRDPYNLLVARQGRFRLDAELVRDNALAISGLLAEKIAGRSVKPYQPDGYWDHCNTFAGKLIYDQDHGEDLYRRGVYTYWKRSFLHPSLVAFDAPSREECTVERSRSNTPLQALVLLNDPTYVEAARALAEQTIRAGGTRVPERLTWAFHRAVARDPTPKEIAVLSALYWKHRGEYSLDRAAAEKLLGVGDHPAPKEINAPELAAWTSVARVVLNIYETVTRE